MLSGIQRDGGRVTIRPSGELDLATAGVLDRQISESVQAGVGELTIDLRDVSFIDSTGVKLLLDWHRRARARRFAFSLIDGGPAVQRVLDLCAVRDVFAFVPAEVQEADIVGL